MSDNNIISRCPICSGNLVISRLSCQSCSTRIETELTLPALTRLPAELQGFVLIFLRCRGNIREVEKELGISYPTVCKRLDLVNEFLGQKSPRANDANNSGNGKLPSRGHILERLERGEITAREAAELLKGR